MNDTFSEVRQALRYCLGRLARSGADSSKLDELASILGGLKSDPPRARLLVDELLEPDGKLVLVGFDVPGIQAYLFDTSKRRIIESASRQLSDADGDVAARVRESIGADAPASLTIFAGGGQGVVLSPKHDEEAVRKGIQAAFANIARTVSVEALAFEPLELVEKDNDAPAIRTALGLDTSLLAPFSELRARLGMALARARRITGQQGTEGERCPFCRVRPPSSDSSHDVHSHDRVVRVCEVCASRWKANKRTDEGPQTFEDIKRAMPSRRVRKEDRVAVVYADGNAIGQVLDALGTLAEYRAFSRALDSAVQRGMNESLEALGRVPYQQLLAGGDDVLLLLPGPLAMELVRRLCSVVEAVFAGTPPPDGVLSSGLEAVRQDLWSVVDGKSALGAKLGRVGLSAGVVFASPSFPLRLMVAYAREVLKTAKRRAHRDTQSAERHYVDFICVEAGADLGIRVQEDRELRYRRSDRWLIQRPYGLAELEVVLREVAALTQIDRSQIYQLREVVLQEQERVGELHLQYQVARHDAWRRFCTELPSLHGTTSPFVGSCGPSRGDLVDGIALATWRRRRNSESEYATPIIDWMELLDHVDVHGQEA